MEGDGEACSVGSVNINIIDSEVDHLYGGGDSDKDADAPDPYTTTIGKASIVLSDSSRVNVMSTAAAIPAVKAIKRF